jgi:isocitrate dehydrogenase kinase/phosphatase
MSLETHAELAEWGAAAVRESFVAYQAEFRRSTRRARQRFEARDWRGAQRDALERLDLRPRCIAGAVDELRGVLGDAASSPELRRCMKEAYARHLADRPDQELARTFFNSVTRRIFGTVGVDPSAEFVAVEAAPSAAGGPPLFATYPRQATTEALVAAILRDFSFSVPYCDLADDARLAAAEVDAQLRAEGAPPFDAVEVLKPVFFRGKGAYLVGRIRRGAAVSPIILSLLHEERGIHVDAVLLSGKDASILFSFTRSYFHVEVEHTANLIDFLRSILPSKPTSEIYISIGYHKHGKTILYRELIEHLQHTTDAFRPARGDRGMVMIVFTLPSLDVVFKVIRDRFAPPKSVTRQEVMQKYALVFRQDRAGRLVDAQEFEHVVVERDRVSPELLDELLREAAESVRVVGDRVEINHLYTERRVVPLNLFIRERDEGASRDALVDYGQAIRDLAATNTFPGDLLLKNFGVTRWGRVIFYDYDELCLVTDCNFRDLPTARDEEEETAGEPWFFVGEDDVFPEEFLPFLGLPRELRDAFVEAHGEILTAEFWRRMQARHRAGEIVDIFPYKQSQRLRH